MQELLVVPQNELIDAQIEREDIFRQGKDTKQGDDDCEDAPQTKRPRPRCGGMKQPESRAGHNEIEGSDRLHRHQTGQHALEVGNVQEPAEKICNADGDDGRSPDLDNPIKN